MDRRRFLRQTGGAAAVGVGAMSLSRGLAAAQTASPATTGASLADRGYPELVITVTADGYEVPAGGVAGLTLVTLENDGTEGVHVFLLRSPDGMDHAEVEAGLRAETLPAWFGASLVGGPDYPPPGGRAQGVVDLPPGQYYVVSLPPGQYYEVVAPAPGQYALANAVAHVSRPFAIAAGDAPAVPGPPATVAVAVTEHEMTFGGLDGPVAAGPQIWEIANAGEQPHELVVMAMPDGMTTGELLFQLFMRPEGATPTIEFAPLFGAQAASPGRTVWLQVDLAPGTYGACCFFPDVRRDWTPHALLGMVAVFTVA